MCSRDKAASVELEKWREPHNRLLFYTVVFSTIDVEAGGGTGITWSFAITKTLKNLSIAEKDIKGCQILAPITFEKNMRVPDFRFIFNKDIRKKFRQDYIMDEYLK